MSDAGVGDRRAIVDEIAQALGDHVVPESKAWWQYVLVTTELGDDCARQLVGEVSAVEASGGMPTQDGSRRRTRGGVFFVLAYTRMGPKRTKSVRWRAERRFQEGMLQRFLRLLALVAPPIPERDTAGADAPPARDPAAATSKPAPKAPAKAPPGAAKPARRQEPEAVEVLVVRRRPAVGGSPTSPTSPTTKPGPSTPGGQR